MRRSERRISSLSVRLFAAVGVFAVVMTTTYYLVVHDPVRRELRHMQEADGKRLFDAIRSHMADEFESAQEQLWSLAALPAVVALEEPGLDHAIRAAEVTTLFRKFTVMNRDGRIVARPSDPRAVGASRADRPYFAETVRRRGLYVGEVVELPGRQGLSLSFGVPILAQGGELRGVLAGHFALSGRSKLSRSMAAIASGASYHALLMSRRGRVIADSRGELSSFTLAEADGRRHPMFPPDGADGPVMRSYVANGVAYNGFSLRFGDPGWVLVLGVEQEPAMLRISSIVNRLALLFGTVFTALLVAATFYGSGIIRRINRLTWALTAYGKDGNAQDLDGSESSGEIGEAVKAFHQMVAERSQVESQLIRQRSELQVLASELSRTEQRMRHKIAAELHDHISQSLAAVKIRLEMLLGRQSSTEREASLSAAVDVLRDTIRVTSDMTRELAQPILQQLGLVKAIESLVQDFQDQHDVDIEFRDDGEPKELPEDLADVVYRAVRELLHNILKHAQATWAEVQLTADAEALTVSVRDNGVGMESGDLEPGRQEVGGFGLFSFGERLRHFGGQLEIATESGGGTHVRMVVPLGTGPDTLSPSLAPNK